MAALSLYNYWVAVVVMLIGIYITIAHGNLVKKLVGLGIFQTAVFLFYLTIGKIEGGTAPIWSKGFTLFTNPLPSVLILTAIVVSVATLAVGLAIVVRIQETYGTVEEDELDALDSRDDAAEIERQTGLQ